MRKLVSFTVGFATAIAIMMRAHRELRVVLVALTGTTMILLLILYLKRYRFLSETGNLNRNSYNKRLTEVAPDPAPTNNSSIRYLRVIIILFGFLMGAVLFVITETYNYLPAVELIGTKRTDSFIVLDYPEHYSYSSRVFVKSMEGYKVNLNMPAGIELKPGDKLTLRVEYSAPGETRDFDFFTYYRSKGIFLDAKTLGEPYTEVCKSVPISLIPVYIRKAICDKLDMLFDGKILGFIKGLLTGDRSDLPQSSQFALSNAGMSHIISVSGMHVLFLSSMIIFAFGSKPASAFIAVPTMLFFVLMTGAASSAIRAFVMQAMVMIAKLTKRDADSLTSISAALLLLLVLNPYCIEDIGLQLSFLATLGMILFLPKIQGKVFKLFPKRYRPKNSVKFIVNNLSTTLSANILTVMPILIYFGRLSIISPIANILSLWMVTLIFYLGIICVIASFIWLPVAKLLAMPLGFGIRYVYAVASISIRLPFAILDVFDPFIMIWVVFMALLIAFWIIRKKHKYINLVVLSVAAISLSFSLLFSELLLTDHDMSIAVLDVGQGQSIVVSSGTYTAMIDCGGNRYPGAGNIAAEYLLNQNRLKVDLLILTHTHSDHINGVEELLDNIDIACVALPYTEAATETAKFLTDRSIDIFYVDDNHAIFMAGCAITLFRPIVKQSGDEETMCVMLSAGEFCALITGDANQISERILAEREELPDINLLVAGHHGSTNSTSDNLLDTISPEVAVISVGQNGYGHPSSQTIDRLKNRGIHIYRTDIQGSLRINIKSRGERYWQKKGQMSN